MDKYRTNFIALPIGLFVFMSMYMNIKVVDEEVPPTVGIISSYIEGTEALVREERRKSIHANLRNIR